MPMEETGPDDNGAESGSGVRASGEAAEEEMRTTAAGKEMGGNEDYRRHYPFLDPRSLLGHNLLETCDLLFGLG